MWNLKGFCIEGLGVAENLDLSSIKRMELRREANENPLALSSG
jgi:hypothetical protein